MASTTRKATVLHTFGAVPLALVTWAIVSTLATFIWGMLNSFLTIMRPEVIGFMANIFGCLFGVGAAKGLCDHWLPQHNGKTVAIFFFVVSGFMLFAEWAIFPHPTHPVLVSAGLVATICAAFTFFWQGASV